MVGYVVYAISWLFTTHNHTLQNGEYTMFEEKTVIVVRELGMFEEEFRFHADTLPLAKHFADKWAKQHDYKLIKSPAKIAEMFPACHRVACNKNEVIFYAV